MHTNFTPYSHTFNTDAETADYIEAMMDMLDNAEIEYAFGNDYELQHAPYLELSVFINDTDDKAEYERILNALN